MLRPLIASLIIAFIGLIIFWVNQKTYHFAKEVADYVHVPKTNRLFKEADSLKYEQDYLKSIEKYNLLFSRPLSHRDSIYVVNQLIYLNLMTYNDTIAKYMLKQNEHLFTSQSMTDAEQADYSFNQGLLSYRLFHPQNAINGLQKALALYKSLYQPNHWKIAQCLTQIGMVYYDIRGISDSVNRYALAAYDMVQTSPYLKKNSASIELLMSLAKWLKRDYDLSMIHAENAMYCAQRRSWIDSIAIATALCYKGQMFKKKAFNVHVNNKQIYFDSAEVYFKISISLIKVSKSSRLQELYKHLLNLYVNLNKKEDFNNYLDTLRQIVKLQGNFYAFEERLIAYNGYINSDYRKCIDYYLFFLNKYSKDSTCNTLLIEEAYYCLIDAKRRIAQYDSSIFYVTQLFNHNNPQIDRKELIIDILDEKTYQKTYNPFVYLNLMGNTLFDQFKVNKKILTLKDALKTYVIADSLLFNRLNAQNEETILIFLKEVGNVLYGNLYSNALEVTWQLYNSTHENIYLELALRFIERIKGNILYRNISQNLPSERMKSLKSELEKLMGLRETSKTWNFELSDKLATTCRDFDKTIADFKTKELSPIPSIVEIKNTLTANQCAIEYFIGSKLYGLFISKDTVIFFQNDLNALKVHLENYRKCLVEFDPKKLDKLEIEFKYSSSELYRILLKPLEPFINRLNDLIIIPDRVLHLVPFEALISHTNWKGFINAPYIIRKNNMTISYIPAWKIYQSIAHKDKIFSKIPSVIAFSYGSNIDLPCSIQEINAIENIIGKENVSLFLKENCSKKTFLNTVNKKNDILHVSLHAKGSLDSPFDNKIWFQSNRNDSLYGFELAGYAIKPPLVVLSACETALGDATAGEGTYSIARNFFSAGALNVIATLWQIDDCANKEVMSSFYKELKKQITPAYALANSKRIFLSNLADNVTAYPSYWAGVICLD
jgi:CHAT domain-containing protein